MAPDHRGRPDIRRFGNLGAIGAGIYQLVKKYNCHEPGCWRIGQHPAADGQFLLCYRHHPDYQGKGLGRPVGGNRHGVELAPQASRWLGWAVRGPLPRRPPRAIIRGMR